MMHILCAQYDNYEVVIVRILHDLFHILCALNTRMNIRWGKIISIKMIDLCSALSIGSIRKSHTLIFQKYKNKKFAVELPIFFFSITVILVGLVLAQAG